MADIKNHLVELKNSLSEIEDWDDYFQDVLDVHYIVNSQKEYEGVRIMLAYGGPTIYLDTYRRCFEGYWWCDAATLEIGTDICKEIDDFWCEIYNC